MIKLFILIFLLFFPGLLWAETGLDWDGTATYPPTQTRRMLYWASPPAAFPMTYLFKVYQRNQVSGQGDGTRYYTTFFHGNNGSFSWGTGWERSFYGAHPYPVPSPSGNGKWEVANNGQDKFQRDDESEPYITNNQWYSQALLANNLIFTFYVDLPSTIAANKITFDSSPWGAYVEPPSPIICMGQAPDPWGGFSRWEEQNAIIRGIQIYNVALSQAQIVQLEALNTDAAVLAKCTELKISAPWYLNMNPTPTDVTDKSGNGHHPVWAGTARPTLYSTGSDPSPAQVQGLRIVGGSIK